MIRRTLSALAIAASLVPFSPAIGTAHAEAAPQHTQVPGYYRMALGNLEITALYDGYVDLDAKLLLGASKAEVQRLLASKFLAGDKVQTAVNAYLINAGGAELLADEAEGRAEGLGGTGVLDAAGQPLFPNAEIRVAQTEADFWLSEANAAKAPDGFKPFFEIARKSVAPYQAAGKFKPFTGEVDLGGIKAVASNGHTPGHTSYLVESAGQRLLILGDAVHSHAVQFARPEVAIEFDSDKKAAIAARKKLFAWAAKDKLLISGMHLPFPGVGHVRAEGKGFAWVPVEYSPLPGSK